MAREHQERSSSGIKIKDCTGKAEIFCSSNKIMKLLVAKTELY